MFAVLLCLVPQSLDETTLPAWRDHLMPRAVENRWQQVGWRSTLGDGLREAAARDRPLLLWVMNGHPLGCT